MVHSFPAAEVELVTHCKNCRYSIYHDDSHIYICNRNNLNIPMNKDDFCSRGEQVIVK